MNFIITSRSPTLSPTDTERNKTIKKVMIMFVILNTVVSGIIACIVRMKPTIRTNI